MAKQRTLIYEIYSPSYLYGATPTLPGLSAFERMGAAARLFTRLDIDYLWLTPIYESGGADGGYDIADLFSIDSRYGTYDHFDVFANSRELSGKVLMDIVLNHTSTASELFKSDLARKDGPTNCIWAKQPNNWDSLFGGSAWEYSPERDAYYLHLFTKGQPDLNWENPAVLELFRSAISAWADHGVAGFRVDTCNILKKSTFADSQEEALKGLEFYHQAGSPEILADVFGANPRLFTVGESVGADPDDLKELSGPLNCCFNAAVNDAADGLFIGPRKALSYRPWFESLLKWCEVPGFVLQFESHDFPRSVDRFRADPRALAILMFFLPIDKICLYQGQELGLRNPKSIKDPTARENARVPASEIFNEAYRQQMDSSDSTWRLYRRLIELWRTDPVLLYGRTEVQHRSNSGRLSFTRTFGNREWEVHIDLCHRGESYATDGEITII